VVSAETHDHHHRCAWARSWIKLAMSLARLAGVDVRVTDRLSEAPMKSRFWCSLCVYIQSNPWPAQTRTGHSVRL
jgi:hypothetical protein